MRSYRLSSVVCRSVTLVSPAKTAEPIKMPFGLRTRVGPGNHVLDGGPDPPHGKGQFWGWKGRPMVKYRGTLLSSVQKRQNRSSCRLSCGLGWAQGIMCYLNGVQIPMGRDNFGGGVLIVKYRHSCCHLCGNGWIDRHAVWIVISKWPKESWISPDLPWEGAVLGQRVAHCKV